MGQIAARGRVALWAVAAALSAYLLAGAAVGLGSAGRAYAATMPGCKPDSGEVVTLPLKAPTETVKADVGDTIKVIVHMKGDRVGVPQPLDHKRAVCRISWHRASASKVIATFLARRAARKITFESTGVTSSQGCPPESHGCPHPIFVTGYARIGVPVTSTY